MLKAGIILIMMTAAALAPTLAGAQHAETRGAQSPAITAGRDATVNNGYTPEQVAVLLKAERTGDEEKIADLSRQLGVQQGAAITVLQIVGEQHVPIDKLPQKLAEVAERYKTAIARLKALDPQDPITRDLVQRAQAAIKAGHLDEADQLVSQAEQAELAAAHQAQQLAQQAQAAADQRLLRAASDRSVRGDIAMTKQHYLDAAQHFQEAADLVPAGHPNEKGRFLFAEADALYQQGDKRGDNPALVKAITAYKLALQQYTRDRVPLDWAMTQNNLGVALEKLGERESGMAHLTEAVAAYRAGLEERTRDRVPLYWAETQFNLGLALMVLGERTHGIDTLKEAVTCFKQAGPVLQAAGEVHLADDSDRKVARLQRELAAPSATGTSAKPGG
jgi:tetratricopeptide (TPR) repeat protein